ncbi:MAG: hypothetical protein IJ849_02845 [Selenomonadaceae bacterium]|nr:hypothetical protein [Selenomonadaceae bacterium]
MASCLASAANWILDLCLVIEEELKGDTVYNMFSIIIDYLNANYRKFMQRIWLE